MDFLSGFAWPLPRAFASAVAAGRFEQGDLLYEDPAAYQSWDAADSAGVRAWVQVLDPPRTARSAPSDAEGRRFELNWSSPVTLALGHWGGPEGGPTTTVRTTQGRLFTCVWRDARELLVDVAPDAEDPPLPIGSRELQKQLEQAVPALRAALPEASSGLCFVSVVDESSEASLAKFRDVEAILSTRYAVTTILRSPAQAGLPEGDAYHPALQLCASAVPEEDPEVIRDLLKRVLYGPTRSDGETDRFKLERHGLLVPVAE